MPMSSADHRGAEVGNRALSLGERVASVASQVRGQLHGEEGPPPVIPAKAGIQFVDNRVSEGLPSGFLLSGE